MSLDDDAEVTIPLQNYNPGTHSKISTHLTPTAKSAGGIVPTNQLGDAPQTAQFHPVQAYQAHLPADNAV